MKYHFKSVHFCTLYRVCPPEILYENDSMKTLTKWEGKRFTSINEGRIDDAKKLHGNVSSIVRSKQPFKPIQTTPLPYTKGKNMNLCQ